MDHAGAIGGQVSDPALSYKIRHHGAKPILYQMCTVAENDTCARITSSSNAFAQLFDRESEISSLRR